MTIKPRKRGRPKSERTLTLENDEKALQGIISRGKSMTPDEIKSQNEWLLNLEQTDTEILKNNVSPPMPKNSVYANESASPEFYTDEEIKTITDNYKNTKRNIHQGQLAGAQKLAVRKNSTLKKIIAKNSVPIQRLLAKKWSVSQAAKKLHEDWDENQYEAKKPSIRTLRRWLA